MYVHLHVYPVLEQGLMLFAAHLFTQKLAHSTIKSYLAAVCYDQICFLGIEKEYDPEVHSCYQDIKVSSHQKPTFLQVSLKALKTDLFRQGVTLYVGATQSDIYMPSGSSAEFYGHQRQHTRVALYGGG